MQPCQHVYFCEGCIPPLANEQCRCALCLSPMLRALPVETVDAAVEDIAADVGLLKNEIGAEWRARSDSFDLKERELAESGVIAYSF